MKEIAPDIVECEEDGEYFDWLADHPSGFVLSMRKPRPMLHVSSCTHVDRHNNAGALTQRGPRQLCSDSKRRLREWFNEEGFSGFPAKCPDCM